MASNHNGSPGPSTPPARSRNSSLGQNAAQQHRPSVPSGLRQAHMPPSSPETPFHTPQGHQHGEHDTHVPHFEQDGIHPHTHDWAPDAEVSEARARGEIDEPDDGQEPVTSQSALLHPEHRYRLPHDCGEVNCTHGTFSPKPRHTRGYGSFASGYEPSMQADDERSVQDGYGGAIHAALVDGEPRRYRGDFIDRTLGDAVTDGLLGKKNKRSTTQWLAKRYGLKDRQWMYLSYYIPFVKWIRQYKLSYIRGDLIAALTMASFYIPMAVSLASNLAHTPPVNGLYSFVFNPLIYALLGSCPQMVVGPEAAGSLLTGSVVKQAIKSGTHQEHEGLKHAQVAGMVTGLAGAVILIAGLCRLGFLDGVLSRPFLRGFISAIGITILTDQMIPEMGLDKPAKDSFAAQHGSSLDKILFLFRHGHEAHRLTCAVSFGTFAIVLVLRELKRRLQPMWAWVAYIPDRFIIVVLSAVLAWSLDWENQGLAVMGDIRSQGTPFKVHFPFDENNFHHVNDAFTTAFIIALLGFFESSVAAKSLGTGPGKIKKVRNQKGEVVEESDGIQGINLSPNRELVALGVANLVGGLFMALPGFGGYGRSKVNASTGGKTPMSSVFLAIITIICILFLLPYFYYIPVRCSHPPLPRCSSMLTSIHRKASSPP